jgi:hypothetical protein
MSATEGIMRRGILASVSVLILGSSLGALAQVDSVVTFDSGSFGWSWGWAEWIETTGGNPGAYLHGDICCAYWPDAFNTSTFTGNYRNAGLASLGIDLIMLQGSGEGRQVALTLLTDNNTPQGEDDWGAFVVGSDGPVPGGGWLSYDFIIPAQEDTLPPGWQVWGTTAGAWADLMQDVDEVRFTIGDPTWSYVESPWTVGMDNVRFSKEQPGRVPPDMVMGKGTLGLIRLVWNPPGGCGHPEDYAVYEGEIGDWDSHIPFVCSDDQGDREERILPSPGNRYYLVVPLGSDTEGSYGLDSNGGQRPPGDPVTCRPGRSFVCP